MKRFKEFVKDQAAKYKNVELVFSAKYEKGKVGIDITAKRKDGKSHKVNIGYDTKDKNANLNLQSAIKEQFLK